MIDELFDFFQNYEVLQVFQPHQGRDLAYYNPNYTEFTTFSAPFSLNIKGDSVEDPVAHFNPDDDATGPAQYEVYLNGKLVVSEQNIIHVDFHEVSFSPEELDLVIGKEPTLPDIIEIKIREVNARYLANEYDSNLYVESILVNSTKEKKSYGQLKL